MVLKRENLQRHIAVALTIACTRSAWSVELTDDTWEAQTANKSVMVLFYDPDNSDCLALKPIWDRLEYFYRNKSDSLVVSVNCAGNQSDQLCKRPVLLPTISHGRPPVEALEDYIGETNWKTIEQFASKELGTVCTPSFLGACDDVMRTQIQELQQMTTHDLETAVEATNEAVTQVKNELEDEILRLQQKLAELKANKSRVMEEVAEQSSDYHLTRAVLSLKEPSFEEPVLDDGTDSLEDLEKTEKMLEQQLAEYEKSLADAEADSKKGKSSEDDEASEEDEDLPEEGEDSSEDDSDSPEEMDGEDSDTESSDKEEEDEEGEGEEEEEHEAADANKVGSTRVSAHDAASTGSGAHPKDEL